MNDLVKKIIKVSIGGALIALTYEFIVNPLLITPIEKKVNTEVEKVI